jgi:sugar-specific transcriptional regulator TrmB
MKNEHLLGVLMELGLKDKEAKVYLACLSLGSTSVSKIAKIADIKRPSAYPVIERLKKFGLMAERINGFKTYYQAEPPEKLELILEQRKVKFKNSLPDFSKLYNLQGQDDLIKRYEGLQAVKSVYEDLLRDVKPHDDYLIISDLTKWIELDKEYFTEFAERRSKLNIKIRMLLLPSKYGELWKKNQRNLNLEIKFLPHNTNLISNMVVIPKRLVIHQLTPPISAMVIENKSAIQLHQQLFNIIWNALPAEKWQGVLT